MKYRYSADATFVGGISYIVADDAFEDIGRLDEDAVWAYIITNVTF